MSTIYLWTPEAPQGYGAFDQDEEIKELCSLCEEQEAKVKIIYENKPHPLTEVSCFRCYSKPDYQVFLKEVKLISVSKI